MGAPIVVSVGKKGWLGQSLLGIVVIDVVEGKK